MSLVKRAVRTIAMFVSEMRVMRAVREASDEKTLRAVVRVVVTLRRGRLER